jgi:hypothetical protein
MVIPSCPSSFVVEHSVGISDFRNCSFLYCNVSGYIYLSFERQVRRFLLLLIVGVRKMDWLLYVVELCSLDLLSFILWNTHRTALFAYSSVISHPRCLHIGVVLLSRTICQPDLSTPLYKRSEFRYCTKYRRDVSLPRR